MDFCLGFQSKDSRYAVDEEVNRNRAFINVHFTVSGPYKAKACDVTDAISIGSLPTHTCTSAGYDLLSTRIPSGYNTVYYKAIPKVSVDIEKTCDVIINAVHTSGYEKSSDAKITMTPFVVEKANGGACSDQGCCPNVSENPIRFSDGAILMSVADISMNRSGLTWNHTRNYSNTNPVRLDSGNGYRWNLDNMPIVKQFNLNGQMLNTVAFARNQNIHFAKSGTSYTSQYGAKPLMWNNTSGKTIDVGRSNGQVWAFHDSTSGNNQMGTLKSIKSPGGATLNVTYSAPGRIATARITDLIAGSTKIEEMVYTYTPSNQIASVTLRRSENSGSTWLDVERVQYTYYAASENYGTLGDLKFATRQLWNGTAWVNVGTHYYRYYKSGESKGFVSGLKYVFNPEDYAILTATYAQPASATDTQVAPFATKYYEYDSKYRVVLEKVRGGKETYTMEYKEYTASATNPNAVHARTIETKPDGSKRKVYTNYTSDIILSEEIPPTGSTSSNLVTYKVYNSDFWPIEEYSPESIVSYSEVVSGNSVTLNVVTQSNKGLVTLTEYYATSSGLPIGTFYRSRVKEGKNGTSTLLNEMQYTTQTVGSLKLAFPIKDIRYTGTQTLTTSYAYTFFSGTFQVEQRTTTLPAVSAANNGNGVAATRVERFDKAGRMIWAKDELGIISYNQYDHALGTRVKSIQDVLTSKTSDFANSVPSGWATVAGAGKHLVSNFEYDAQGRMTQTLAPQNTSVNASNQSINTRTAAWTVYDDVNRKTTSASGFATVDANGNVTAYTLVNPVSIAIRDSAERVVEQIQAKRTSTTGKLLATDTFAQSSYVAWSKNIYTGADLTATWQYFAIPVSGTGTKGTNYYETVFGYDAMGRQNRVVSPDGTIVRTVFDWRSNPIQNWVGTNDTGATDGNPKGAGGTNNMVILTETEYGGGAGCATCSASKDKPRVMVQYVDAAKTRVTEFGYDWRGRQTHVHGEDDAEGNSTYTVQTYDYQNRVTKSERYLTAPGSSSGSSSGSSFGDRLLARTEQYYDERGRVFKTVQSIVNPANGGVTGKMQTRTWFDQAGRVIKSQGLGENHFTKNVYDSLGRVVKSYVSTNPSDTTYATASVITGDTVHQQSEMTYDKVGNPILAANVERMVSQSGTGELKIAAAPKGRYQFTASWFDPMGRQIATADYGTNGDAALTRPAVVPTRSDNVLVTETFYDANTGRAYRSVDPAGKDHRTFFDALGRTTKTIANYVSGTPAAATPDRDVTVEMTYHASGQVATMTAKNLATGDQVTRYVYGTSKTSVAPLVHRNDVLVCEIYPDSDDLENTSGVMQNGADGVADRVEFQYNRTGELIWKKDQNGTIHIYEFDNLGRLIHDRVTTLGSGVDGSVRRISTAYDVIGNVKIITSYNSATVGSGNVVNEVKYEYDANGLLAKEYQNPSGAATTSSLYVGYSYDATKSGELFTKRLRPTSVRYPSAQVVNYTYGTSGSVDDLLNRFTVVKNGTTNLAEYTDMGVATPAIVKYSQPNLTLDYTSAGAVDRFGRITDHAWKNSSGTALVQIKHGYDRVGNRLYREDAAAANAGKSFDELYAYDGMNQVTDMQRGKLNATKNGIASGKSYEDNFTFDATGNFATYKQDKTGGGFTLTQNRTHTKANEIATIAGVPTYVANDANGNMTKVPQPDNWSAAFNLVYDAWNRLVTLKDTTNTMIIVEYRYDGMNRRVLRKKYANGTLSETRGVYFNRQWQCVEEYVGTGCTARYFWGQRYIDDLIMRQRGATHYVLADANWNVTAYVDTSGVVQERYAYSSFGKLYLFDAAFVSRSASPVGVTHAFTGQVFDGETGLMLYRNRVYHPTLGRFVQRDPIGYSAGDENLYRYIWNTPIIYMDIFGLRGGVVARPPVSVPRPVTIPGGRTPYNPFPNQAPVVRPRPISPRPISPRPVPRNPGSPRPPSQPFPMTPPSLYPPVGNPTLPYFPSQPNWPGQVDIDDMPAYPLGPPNVPLPPGGSEIYDPLNPPNNGTRCDEGYRHRIPDITLLWVSNRQLADLMQALGTDYKKGGPPHQGPPRPHSTCTVDYSNFLHAIQNHFCGKARSCDGTQDLRTMVQNYQYLSLCRDIRQTIMDQCFGGGDANHKTQLDQVNTRIEDCESQFYNFHKRPNKR